MKERMIPNNIDAELCLLGSIMLDNEALEQVRDYVNAEDFYRESHRLIYEAMLELKQGRSAIDFITLSDALGTHDRLEQVGGEEFIMSLQNQLPTSANFAHYARIVRRTSTARKLIQVSGEIVAQAYEGAEVEEILEQAERNIFAISQEYLLIQAMDIGFSTLMHQYMNTLEKRFEGGGNITGIPTGYDQLDSLLGGFQCSDLNILAARTSIGKTAFAINLAYNAAIRCKRRVGIFSLEMNREQLAQRFVALDSGIQQQTLRMGDFDDEHWAPLVATIGKLSDLGEHGIRIDDTPGITLTQMRSRARRWIAEYNIELIIVDYLQLVNTGEKKGFENRQQEVATISRQLTAMARELNVPVLALAQLSRALEARQSKVPILSDLRESGGIENDADVVMFIYRDEIYTPNTTRRGEADIIIAKQRNGPLGEVTLHFDQAKSRFSNPTTSPNN